MRNSFLFLLITVAGCTSTWAASVTVALGGANYLCQALDPIDCTTQPYTFLNVNGGYVGEDVDNSGLESVDSISLSLKYFDSLNMGLSETYDVLINGTSVGSFLVNGVNDMSSQHLVVDTFSFAPIEGPDYSVLFRITSDSIGPGGGSLGWVNDGTSTFTLSRSSVPEPRQLPMLALLFGSVAFCCRRTMRSRS